LAPSTHLFGKISFELAIVKNFVLLLELQQYLLQHLSSYDLTALYKSIIIIIKLSQPH